MVSGTFTPRNQAASPCLMYLHPNTQAVNAVVAQLTVGLDVSSDFSPHLSEHPAHVHGSTVLQQTASCPKLPINRLCSCYTHRKQSCDKVHTHR